MLVLEPDTSAAAAFLKKGRWRNWIESGRLTYLVGSDYAGAENAWRLFPATPGGFEMLVHPALAHNVQPSTVAALRVVKRIAYGARANADAQRKLAPKYLVNTLRNLPALVAGHDVRSLTDAYRGIPAVIAAAGPSLDAVIDDLSAATGRALLIAVDTALRPLLTRGLEPQIVVGLDPSELNARHFHGLPDCPDTWLVAESALDPSATSRFAGRTFWFRVARHHPWPWYHEIGIDVGFLEVWGSVVTAAFQVAMLAGCEPIVLVGADLSFTGGHPYCRGTTYEFDAAGMAAQGTRLENVWDWLKANPSLLRVPDVRGAETVSTESLVAFRDWMVTTIARSGRRVVNATGGGILFGNGVEQTSLAGAITKSVDVASPGTFPRRPSTALSARDVAARVQELRRAFTSDTPLTPPASHWAEFTGAGWDPSAVAQSLDAALRDPDASGQQSRAVDDMRGRSVWPDPPDTVRLILPRLPEALARWRAALNGIDPLPAAGVATGQNDVDPAALLVDALDLLRWICVAVREEPEDLPTLDAFWANRTPIAVLSELPERIRWTVLLFEGLLGTACQSPFPPTKDSFFSRPVVLRESDVRAERRPNWTAACALLAFEWLMSAKAFTPVTSEDVGHLQRWMQGVGPLVCSAGVPALHGALTLIVEADGRSDTAEVPVTIPEAALARVRTGELCWLDDERSTSGATPEISERTDPFSPSAHIEVPGVRPLSQDACRRFLRQPQTTGARCIHCASDQTSSQTRGVPTAHIVYATPAGVVGVSPYTRESFVVHRDGSVRTLHSWPRPILGELPLGEDGAVAWSNATPDEPRFDSGYVMYRHRADELAVVQELPFRPNWGTWLRERLYWACFPAGVGTWAPRADPTFELRDLPLVSLYPDQDTTLVLVASVGHGDEHGGFRITDNWRWQVGETPTSVPLGPDGAASFRATGEHGWTAIAYPDSDTIRLERDGRIVRLTCYYPFRLAWMGGSLMVSTFDGELLLFEDLARVLDSLSHT